MVADISQLRELVEQRCRLECAMEASIDGLRAAGVGWPVIADALGASRQAVRQRAQRRAKT